MKTKFFFFFLFLVCLIQFYPFVRLNFVQDDFFLLTLSNADNIKELVYLFRPDPEVVWYRPLSSQVFFLVGKVFFQLDPLGYHLIILVTHLFSAALLYYLSMEILKNKKASLLACMFYLLNSSFAVALGWLSTYSFVMGPFLFLIFLMSFIKGKYKISITVFLLGILTTEVFLLSLGVILVVNFLYKIVNFKKLILFFIIPLPIFIYRFLIVGNNVNTNDYSFSLISSLPSVKYYFIRIFGLSDYLYNNKSNILIFIILICFIFIILITIFLIKENWKQIIKNLIIPIAIVISFSTPFIFLGNHRAPYYMSFTLIGVSLLFGLVFINLNKYKSGSILLFLIISGYLVIQSISTLYTYKNHWIVSRSYLSKTLVDNDLLIAPVGTEEYFSLGANKAEVVYK